MHLVVGLGNPGPEYRDNRHNLGFMVVDVLGARARGSSPRTKFGAELSEVTLAGERILLCKPMEFMNVSGQAVARVAGFWKIPVADIIVVHDELDLAFGRLKLGAGGGHGGHNGIRSMLADLGDAGFARVRVGVGRPAPGRSASTELGSAERSHRGRSREPSQGSRLIDPADYLLSDFSRAEAKELPALIDTAADAVEVIVKSGLTAAMNKFNTKPSNNNPKDRA